MAAARDLLRRSRSLDNRAEAARQPLSALSALATETDGASDDDTDPELLAELNALGWDQDQSVDVDTTSPSVEEAEAAAAAARAEAVSLKRAGRQTEARDALRRCKQLTAAAEVARACAAASTKVSTAPVTVQRTPPAVS